MKHASYLKHLRFDRKLTGSIQAKYLKNPRLLVLLLTMIVSFGIFSYTNIPRRLNPEIKIPLVVISTVFPGTSPSDVEQLLTDPIEHSLGSVQKIKTYSSVSRDSVSVITIEFESGVDADTAVTEVKSAVDSVSIPDDAIDPNIIKIDFERFPVWSFSLVSKSGDTASLITFSKELEERLDGLQLVDEVSVSGLEEQEIQILLKPEQISTYQINPSLIMAAIRNATNSLPAGNVRTDNSSFTLSIDPTITNIDDIREIKIRSGESIINLSDVANISIKSKPSQLQSYVSNKKIEATQAVSFSIFKTENADISKTVESADKEIEDALKQYDNQFAVFTVSDISEQIDEQFNGLIRDFIITISMVFLALLIFLGIRQAIVASLSIPITFLITFIVMNLFGVALSFISFFSLLLALGLLVDDTIVVISAMTSYHRSGKFSPFETGLLVWRDFIVAIFTTTLTTVWAFIPLLMSSGIIGEFIKPIPIVVSTTLMASFFVAMFITLPVITFLLHPNMPKRVRVLLGALGLLVIFAFVYLIAGKSPLIILIFIVLLVLLFISFKTRTLLLERINRQRFIHIGNVRRYLDQGILSFEPVSIKYQLLIKKILASKRWIRVVILIVILFSVFSYSLLPLGFVKNEFFPKTDSDQLIVSVELPVGTNVSVTKNEALSLLSQIRKEEDVETVALNMGQSPDEFGGVSSGDVNEFAFNLTLSDDKKKSSEQIAAEIRNDFKNYSKGKISVLEPSGGPPAGSDIQIKLIGPDLGVLDQYANEIMNYLVQKPGVANVDKSIKPGTSKVTFIPDPQKLSENGVAMDQVALSLRTYASGLELDSVKFDISSNDEQDITLRFSDSDQFVESIDSLLIPAGIGTPIPVTSLGTIELQASPALITRENGERTISVTASVTGKYGIQDVNSELERFAESLDLPSGYEWKTGGVNEENQSSLNTIFIAMILSFLLILVTLVLQFSSFRKAFIVLLVIPLSISGVFIMFALTNTYLSFPALIGVLALFGIVVKNSILIVDKIQANEKTKMSFEEGIAEGAASRLEAIALTSFTAILGLLPVTLSDPLWRGLGGAIIAGLTFSGTIMLFFIPVVYYLIFRSQANSRRRKVS